MDLHRRAALRSLAYHRAVAERLSAEVIARARARVASGASHPHWAAIWAALLALPAAELAQRLVADDEAMRAARQSSPFTDVLTPRERWQIWREAGAAP